MIVTLLVVLVSVIVFVWGWLRWHKGSWKILSQIDPDPHVEFDQLLFLDEHRGFAFAHSEPEVADTIPNVTDRFRAEEAWVYTTTDGGLHWQTRKSLGRGYVVDVNKIPGGAILLVQRYVDDDDNWKAYLQISEDDGATWSKADGRWDIVGRQFLDDARGFLWGNGPERSWTNDKGIFVTAQPSLLYYTDDHAKTWEQIQVPPEVSLQTYRPVLHPDGSFFYLHEDKLIHLIRQPDGRWREEIDELPLSLTGDMLYANTYGDNKTVWVVAHEPPPPPPEPQDIVQARLLRWDGSGKIAAVPGLSFPKGFMVDAMFVYDSVVTIIGADYSGESAFAPVTVFRSEDGGKSWKSEGPAIRDKARPVAFYGPNNIWAVGTYNRLQHRK